MNVKTLHPWDVGTEEATSIQQTLCERVQIEPLTGPVRIVAGADLSYSKNDDRLFAGVVIMRVPEMETLEQVCVMKKATFPYIPGFLSFREIPPLVGAFEKIRTRPDAIICDGQGIAHPRFFGLAAHLGLLLDLPAVGCGKTRLVGEFEEPANRRWASSAMIYRKKQVGLAVRSRQGVTPIYLSPGHKIDFTGCLELIKISSTKYRLPEPIRAAHHLVNEKRREAGAAT